MYTQMVIGKTDNGFSSDDYIVAALMLYLSIIDLFLCVLRLVGEARD